MSIIWQNLQPKDYKKGGLNFDIFYMTFWGGCPVPRNCPQIERLPNFETPRELAKGGSPHGVAAE
jgi:hypothetical protein